MAGNFLNAGMQCKWCDNNNQGVNLCQRCSATRCRAPRWPGGLSGCNLVAASGYENNDLTLGGGPVGGTFGTGCCAQYTSFGSMSVYESPRQCGIDWFERWSLSEMYLIKGIPWNASMQPPGFFVTNAYDRVPIRRVKNYSSNSYACGWGYSYAIDDFWVIMSRQRVYGVCKYCVDFRVRGRHRFVRGTLGLPPCGSTAYQNYLSCLQGENQPGCEDMLPWMSDNCDNFAEFALGYQYPFTLTYSAIVDNLNDPIVFSAPYAVRSQCSIVLPATARATYLGHDFRPESGPIPVHPNACASASPFPPGPPSIFCGVSPGACPIPSNLGAVPGGLCNWLTLGSGYNVTLETETELFNRVFETKPGVGPTSPTLPDFSTWTLTL